MLGLKGKSVALVILLAAAILSSVLLVGCLGGGPGAKPYVISGTVTDQDGNAVEGVELIISGGASTIVRTKKDGTWEAEVKGTVLITPSMGEYTFVPASRKADAASKKLDFTRLSPVRETVTKTVGAEGGTIVSELYADAPAILIPPNTFLDEVTVSYRVLDEVQLPTDLLIPVGMPIAVEIDVDVNELPDGSCVTVSVDPDTQSGILGVAVLIDGYWIPLTLRSEDGFWLADLPLDMILRGSIQSQAKTGKDILVCIFDISKDSSDPGHAMFVYEFENGQWSAEPIFRTDEANTGFLRSNGSDVILMVHGIAFGSYDGWTDLASYISGIDGRTKIYAVEYGTGYPLDKLGQWLAQIIFQGVEEGHKIKVVAHSQGGVIARAALELYGAEHLVTDLVTLASPHEGVLIGMLHTVMLNYEVLDSSVKEWLNKWVSQALGRLVGESVPEVPDLARGSEFLQRLNNLKPSDCKYYFAAGTSKEGYPATRIIDTFYDGYTRVTGHEIIHDGVVEKESALGESLNMSAYRANFEAVEFPVDHGSIVVERAVFEQIRTWLNIKPRVYSVCGRVTDEDGEGISNVVITFDGEDKSWTPVTTSASGVWSKDGLTGVVTVTPERADFRFVPSFLRVNDSQEVNFIGVEPSESYVVSGRVIDSQGHGIAGVSLAAVDNGRVVGTAISHADGTWEIQDLVGLVIIVPSREGYCFAPEASVRITGEARDVNFVASPITYSASGKVTEKYTGHSVKGVSITFSHGHDEVVTGEDGTWRKSGLAGEVKITPRKDGWVFEPPTLAVSKETNGVDFVGWRGAEEAVMQATCGHFHTLAVGDRGTVWAWGLNESGQLGSGETTPYETIPILVEGLPSIKMVAAGSYFSLALDFDGRVWAWGDNRYGQLGISPAETGTHLSATPLLIDSIDDVVFIAAGAYHSLAIRGDGSVWAWGSNGHGQLGDVTGAHSAVPVEVVGLTDVISVAALSNYSLALKSDGTVWIWGMSQTVRPGLGGPDRNDIPVQVTSIEDVIGIAAGHGHSLALKSDGTFWSWGNNSDGQLGNGTYTSSTTPVQVDGLHDVTAIAAGHGHSLAACSDGSAWAWGDNSFGQLGIGVGPGKRCNPVQVADFGNVMGLGAGWMHSLALTQDGELWAWGLNYSGELGDGTCTNRPLPVPVAF